MTTSPRRAGRAGRGPGGGAGGGGGGVFGGVRAGGGGAGTGGGTDGDGAGGADPGTVAGVGAVPAGVEPGVGAGWPGGTIPAAAATREAAAPSSALASAWIRAFAASAWDRMPASAAMTSSLLPTGARLTAWPSILGSSDDTPPTRSRAGPGSIRGWRCGNGVRGTAEAAPEPLIGLSAKDGPRFRRGRSLFLEAIGHRHVGRTEALLSYLTPKPGECYVTKAWVLNGIPRDRSGP